EQAASLGLTSVALADHNTVGGLTRFMRAMRQDGPEAVAGVEFSTQWQDTELHLLGLFLPESSWAAIDKYLQTHIEKKEMDNRRCTERLQNAGYPVSYELLCRAFPMPLHNRMHIARVLVDQGICSSTKEAFATFLQKGGTYYYQSERPSFLNTVELIRAWGGVSVWAHPLLQMDGPGIRAVLAQAGNRKPDGIETRYGTYTEVDETVMDAIAREAGLLPSGGSDYHGPNKPAIALGSGEGRLSVPSAYAAALKQKALERQK
ncbi:MAG: hypothetical protein IJP30_05280, partial [Clostridia bacterium]|nr:hypothetical protein [Clostridia bacterium]